LRLFLFATMTELFGCGLVSAGLAYEVATGADLGFFLITSGSAVIAFGSLLYAKVNPLIKKGK